MDNNKSQQSPAFITLISVLILSAVGLSVSVFLILFSVGSSRNSFSSVQSAQARLLAAGCAESALEQIRESTSYSGTTNLSFSQGTCSYTVTLGVGEARTISASGTVGAVVRRLSISVTAINPTITVSSWQEVP